jgi:uncharacterized protein (TIGR04255 family)
MNNWESFKNPPIREAIFSVTFSEDFSPESLAQFIDSDFIKAKFSPKAKPLFKAKTTFEEKDGEFQVKNSSKTPDGYRLDSDDKFQTLILKSNQFAYHKIQSYSSWEESINEFNEIWDCINQNDFHKCNSLGVRFVNVIKLPFESVELNDFFALYPTIPSGIPQTLEGFFMTVTIPKGQMRANIIQTVESNNSAKNDKIGIILDIDITKPIYKTLVVGEDFQEMRDYKNELFFNIITEKTRNIIKNQ